MHGENWCCSLMSVPKDRGSYSYYPSFLASLQWMALDCKAMLHLFCLKQLQKNSVPALIFLHFVMQAEQRGSATSEEAKNLPAPPAGLPILQEGIQQLPPAWKSVVVSAAHRTSLGNMLSLLPHSLVCLAKPWSPTSHRGHIAGPGLGRPSCCHWIKNPAGTLLSRQPGWWSCS